jgi:hypothetical protein
VDGKQSAQVDYDMDTVYKFCRGHGLNILRNLELKITPPNEFNDPFEFTPKNGYSDQVGYARRQLQQEPVIKWLYDTMHAQGTFVGSSEEFQEWANEPQGKVIEAFVNILPHGAAHAAEDLLDAVSKRMAILCMSGRRDSILMWGHYCHSVRGIVIGFDKSSAIFQHGKGLRPVKYDKQRVWFDACWEIGSPEMAMFDDQITFSKSTDWSYEEEFRQIFTLPSSLLVKKAVYDIDRTWGCFLPFPPEAIVSVTLGPRCSPEFESEVREVHQKPCFAHVKFDRAVLHESDFVLDFTEFML